MAVVAHSYDRNKSLYWNEILCRHKSFYVKPFRHFSNVCTTITIEATNFRFWNFSPQSDAVFILKRSTAGKLGKSSKCVCRGEFFRLWFEYIKYFNIFLSPSFPSWLRVGHEIERRRKANCKAQLTRQIGIVFLINLSFPHFCLSIPSNKHFW